MKITRVGVHMMSTGTSWTSSLSMGMSSTNCSSCTLYVNEMDDQMKSEKTLRSLSHSQWKSINYYKRKIVNINVVLNLSNNVH